MHISMTREALLERLENRLEAAKKDDAKAAKDHATDEQRALKEFKDRCRKALGWDYPMLKRQNYEIGIKYGSRPTCPSADADKIKRAIAEVKLDKRDAYTIAPGSDIHDAINWLPRAERPKLSMC